MSTQPKPDAELVEVFDTQQESEAMVVHSLLTSAGIESLVTNLDAPQDVFPGVGGVVVRVNPEDAEQAREIIADYRRDAASGDESDPSEDELDETEPES